MSQFIFFSPSHSLPRRLFAHLLLIRQWCSGCVIALWPPVLVSDLARALPQCRAFYLLPVICVFDLLSVTDWTVRHLRSGAVSQTSFSLLQVNDKNCPHNQNCGQISVICLTGIAKPHAKCTTHSIFSHMPPLLPSPLSSNPSAQCKPFSSIEPKSSVVPS